MDLLEKICRNINCFKEYDIKYFDEDIEVGPTSEVVDKAKGIVSDLINNDLIPYSIGPTVEEGLCFVFNKENILAYVELYNDGDIGMLAEDYINKKILQNIELEIDEIIPALKTLFK